MNDNGALYRRLEKLECCRFVADAADDAVCQCGESRGRHWNQHLHHFPSGAETPWRPSQDTIASVRAPLLFSLKKKKKKRTNDISLDNVVGTGSTAFLFRAVLEKKRDVDNEIHFGWFFFFCLGAADRRLRHDPL